MKTTLLTLASIALLSSAVFAADDQTTKPAATAESHGQPAAFEQHDKNHDGKISKEEAVNDMVLTEQWDEVDENEDGSIDVTEFSMFEPKSAVEAQEENGDY